MKQLFLSEFEASESGMERRIHEIESLNLSLLEQARLILVLLGARKGENVSFYENYGSPEEIKQILVNRCGMYMEKMKRSRVAGKLIDEYAVALDAATAKKLSELDPSIDHQEFGRMMGYPESAVEAFCGGERLEKKEYPGIDGIIFKFTLSKNNWREEVKVLREWSDLIKESAPELYEKILRQRKTQK